MHVRCAKRNPITGKSKEKFQTRNKEIEQGPKKLVQAREYGPGAAVRSEVKKIGRGGGRGGVGVELEGRGGERQEDGEKKEKKKKRRHEGGD